MVDRFFLPDDFSLRRGVVTLDREESEHALRSRRLRAGDSVELLNGRGAIAFGKVVKAARDGCAIEIESITELQRDPPAVHLAASVPRGPRMDSLLDGCAQLGIVTLTPVIFERSVAAREDVSPARIERWHRIAREAAKQSGEPFELDVREICTLDALLAIPFEGRRFLLHPREGAAQLANALPAPGEPVQLIVGPEGGLLEREADRIVAAGAELVRLGRSLLRIEMAALAACAVARLR